MSKNNTWLWLIGGALAGYLLMPEKIREKMIPGSGGGLLPGIDISLPAILGGGITFPDFDINLVAGAVERGKDIVTEAAETGKEIIENVTETAQGWIPEFFTARGDEEPKQRYIGDTTTKPGWGVDPLSQWVNFTTRWQEEDNPVNRVASFLLGLPMPKEETLSEHTLAVMRERRIKPGQTPAEWQGAEYAREALFGVPETPPATFRGLPTRWAKPRPESAAARTIETVILPETKYPVRRGGGRK